MLRTGQTFAYAYFDDEKAAANAVQTLIGKGFDSEHIGVLVRGETNKTEDVQLDHKTGIGPGAAIGSLLGAAAGAVALPAAGVVALGGAFAALGGAAVGGATGTLAGVLGGLGIWHDKAPEDEDPFKGRGVVVGALTPQERTDSAREALRSAGAAAVEVANQAEASKALEHFGEVDASRLRNVNPDTLARNIFLLTLAYVFAVGGAIWLFIRPV